MQSFMKCRATRSLGVRQVRVRGYQGLSNIGAESPRGTVSQPIWDPWRARTCPTAGPVWQSDRSSERIVNHLLPTLDGELGDHPAAVAVAGESVSWAQLRRRSGAVAQQLSGMSAVALRATNTLDTVVGVVAGLMAGVPVVPIPADAGPMEREHMLRDSRAS